MTNDNTTLQHVSEAPFRAYTGDGKYLFISYAHVDAPQVFPDLIKFRELGYNVWYDQGIATGMDWTEEIEKALLNCTIFVVFISDNSIESRNVRNEINLALSRDKPLVIIYLENAELKHGLSLTIGTIQGILKYTMPEDQYALNYINAFKNLGMEIVRKLPQSNNFSELEKLLNENKSYVKLDKDIILDKSEINKFKEGITIRQDNLTIDGDNHTIDASTYSRILKIVGKNITIKNLIFKNGRAYNTSENKHETGGGAILIENDASLSLENCEFYDNYSESDGGAIFNKSEDLHIERSIFKFNKSKISGGAIANIKGMTLYKTRFMNNESFNGGSIYNYYDSTLNMRNCKIRENRAEFAAGGIYNYGELKIDDNTNFRKNSSSLGGAIVNYGIGEITGASFKKNSAEYGGAIFNINHGKLKNYSHKSSSFESKASSMELNDCSFASNNAEKIGGIIYNLSECKLTECVMGNNTANEFGNLINNGPEGVSKDIGSIIRNNYVSILDISTDSEIILKQVLESNAIYNQENCLLKVSNQSIFNQQPPNESSGIFLNKGELNFY